MKKKHCTGWLDRLFKKDWSECCKQHDIDYTISKNCKYKVVLNV